MSSCLRVFVVQIPRRVGRGHIERPLVRRQNTGMARLEEQIALLEEEPEEEENAAPAPDVEVVENTVPEPQPKTREEKRLERKSKRTRTIRL